MLPWIGGKYKQANWIWDTAIGNLVKNGNIKTYVEPFGGMFWNYLKTDIYKHVNNVYYNDQNKYLVNMFYFIKDKERRKELLEVLEKLEPANNKLFEDAKEFIFEKNSNQKLDMNFTIGNLARAAAYVYAQSLSYSGTHITRNMKICKQKKQRQKIDVFKDRLKNKDRFIKNLVEKLDKITAVNNKDYKEVIKEYDAEDTLFYLDPPYIGKEKYYIGNNMKTMIKDERLKEHKQLAELLKNIKGKFVLSYDIDGIDVLKELYPENKFYYFTKEYAKVASNKKVKEKNIEVLITNFNPADYVVVNNVDYKTKTDEIITRKTEVANNKNYKNKEDDIDIVALKEELKELKKVFKYIKKQLLKLNNKNNNNKKEVETKKVVNGNVITLNLKETKNFIKDTINKVIDVKNVKVVNNVSYTNKKVKYSYSKVLLNDINYFNSVITIKQINNIVNNVKVKAPPFLINNKYSCS